MGIFLFFVNKFESRYSISFQKIIHIGITGLLIMTSPLWLYVKLQVRSEEDYEGNRIHSNNIWPEECLKIGDNDVNL